MADHSFGSFADRVDGLTKEQRELLALPLRIPVGYGMRVLPQAERAELLAEEGDAGLYDRLLVWEPPRRGHLYVISVDVSNGIGLDNSVIDVTRVGTIREPDEQVAQFVTDHIEPDDLAPIVDPIGRLYTGRDGIPAMVAVECNGLGLGTQATLQKQIGYPNFYIWQTLDSRDPSKAFTQRIGWWTSQRSRPLLINNYYHAIKTIDPNTGWADYRVNSPHTIRELATFISPGPLWMAEAADGGHDDCIMAGAIGVYVAKTLQEVSRETVHEARKRLTEEVARLDDKRKIGAEGFTAQNTDVTYQDLYGGTNLYEDHDPHAI